jgi:hypothetical protein
MKHIKLFENFQIFSEEEIKNLPKSGDILYWVESGQKYEKTVKHDPVKVRFEQMDNINKNRFAHITLEENSHNRKRGEKVSTDVSGLFKSKDEAYSHSRK